MRAPSWQQCATSVEELLLGLLASLFSLLGRLLGSTCRRLLGGALRLVQAAQWTLGFLVPGSFQLAHTVADRWAAGAAGEPWGGGGGRGAGGPQNSAQQEGS